MAIVQKTIDITVSERRKDGGRIVISTGRPDRDKDRVFPTGAKLESYLNNPVVLWGHNAFEPWAIIGRSRTVEVNEVGLVADFEFREPASATDPMHVIRYLWDEEFVRAASIGFRPESGAPNDMGGIDFTSWELLEWSIVTVPANADALRLAAKSFPQAFDVFKRGRVLSAKNEGRIRTAYDALGEVLGEIDEASADDAGKRALDDIRKEIGALRADVLTLGTPPAPAPAPIQTLDVSPLMEALAATRAALVNRS